MRRRPFDFLLLSIASLVAPPHLVGQGPVIRGYYLNVGSGLADGPFSESGVLDFQRLRLMTDYASGPFSFDAAYEHALSLTTQTGASGLAGGVGQLGGGIEWLPLQGTIASGERTAWTHRVDRLSIAYVPNDAVELIVGRQTISWATTLVFTPADPFAPFDPSEPFREYRAGVDAVRFQAFTGPFTEFEAVVRPTDTGVGETLTALGRVKTLVGELEMAAWAGVLHDEPAAAVALTATPLGWALRAEGVVRREAGEEVVRASIGVDRNFFVAGRDLYLVLEYQRDGFGAVDGEDLLAVATSAAARRSELQVFGRNVGAVQASYRLSPLVSLSALTIANMNDGSLLLAPAVGYSAGEEVSLRGGLFLGVGDETLPTGAPASEYGAVPFSGYASVTMFF